MSQRAVRKSPKFQCGDAGEDVDGEDRIKPDHRRDGADAVDLGLDMSVLGLVAGEVDPEVGELADLLAPAGFQGWPSRLVLDHRNAGFRDAPADLHLDGLGVGRIEAHLVLNEPAVRE